MKAILATRYCSPDELILADLPDPTPAADEVLVAVKAVGLNFFDLLLIAGKYQRKPPFPFSPGAEFSGVVEAVGAAVTTLRPGDRVAGYIGDGAAREKVIAGTDQVVKLPDRLDFERAAGLVITYATTLYALEDRGQLRPGETLAVLGAAGGTGVAACEIGKIMGARVIACASSADKIAFAKRHGADEGLDYAAEDLKDGLRRLTGGKGVDVIYDPVGGPYAEPALRAIAWEGRFLVIGFATGEIPKVPFNLMLLKSCDVRGVHWGSFAQRDPHKHRANIATLMQWAADGKLSAHVHATFPLAQTSEALKVLAARKAMGKVILTA